MMILVQRLSVLLAICLAQLHFKDATFSMTSTTLVCCRIHNFFLLSLTLLAPFATVNLFLDALNIPLLKVSLEFPERLPSDHAKSTLRLTLKVYQN